MNTAHAARQGDGDDGRKRALREVSLQLRLLAAKLDTIAQDLKELNENQEEDA